MRSSSKFGLSKSSRQQNSKGEVSPTNLSLVDTSLAAAQQLLTNVQCYLACRCAGNRPTQEMETAWNEFYAECSNRIRRFACTCGICETDLPDCVQEVWRELLVRLPTFHFDPERGKFDTWLFAIVRSKSADLLRRRGPVDLPAYEFSDDTSDPQNNPLANLEDQELLATALAHLRRQLPECNYHILHLRLIEQRPVAEVAEQLRLTHEQVWYRCYRARRQLTEIACALLAGNEPPSTNEPFSEKIAKKEKCAPGIPSSSVSRERGKSDIAMDFTLKRLELGRQGTGPEWKVEWNGTNSPHPTLLVRKLSMVAYAELCGPEETINSYWPQITNAAVAAGVAAGIATIIATPTAALPVFRAEFVKQLCGKTRKEVSESIQVALSARQEANGPWRECGG